MTRAHSSQKRAKEVSLVGFKEKPLDVYDTLAVFLGSSYPISNEWTLLSGLYYDPASVGPGESGTGGKTGFGFLDLANSLGSPPSKPQIGVGFGSRYAFYSERPLKRRKRRQGSNVNSIAKSRTASSSDEASERVLFEVEAGLVYSQTEIGIGANGEQPAAYFVRRIQIPIQLSYRF